MKVPFINRDKDKKVEEKEKFTSYTKEFKVPFLKLNFFPYGGYVGDIKKITFGYYSSTETLAGVKFITAKFGTLSDSNIKNYPLNQARWFHPEFIFPRGVLNSLNIAGAYSGDSVRLSPFEKTTIYVVGDELGMPMGELQYPIRTQEVMQILDENRRLRDESLALKLGRDRLVKERAELHASNYAHIISEIDVANEIANAVNKGKHQRPFDEFGGLGREYGYGYGSGYLPHYRYGRGYLGAEEGGPESQRMKRTKQDELRERFEEKQKQLRGEL